MCHLGLEEQQDNVKTCRLVSCTRGQGTSRELERRSNSSSAREAGSTFRGASAWRSEVLGSSVVFLLCLPVPVNMGSCSLGSGVEEQPVLGTLGFSAQHSFRGQLVTHSPLALTSLTAERAGRGERERNSLVYHWSESRAFLKFPAWKPNKNT